MKKELKKGLLIVSLIILIVTGLLLSFTIPKYAIIIFTIAIVDFLFTISYITNNKNPNRLYESTVKGILKTYDSILVKSNNVPNLQGRNIINVSSMDDLVDAQIEIRKPICYIKQTESCSFVLLDNKEAYVYIHKLNDTVTSPLEIEIKAATLKNKKDEEIDSDILKNIEKTTIVKLSNKKSYKVSPIRKEIKAKEEIEII